MEGNCAQFPGSLFILISLKLLKPVWLPDCGTHPILAARILVPCPSDVPSVRGRTTCFSGGALLDHCTGVPSYPAASVPFGVFLRSICSEGSSYCPPKLCADEFARNKPGRRDPWFSTGYARCSGASADGGIGSLKLRRGRRAGRSGRLATGKGSKGGGASPGSPNCCDRGGGWRAI